MGKSQNCIYIFQSRLIFWEVLPVNVNNGKAGCKTELAKKSKGRNNKGKTLGKDLDSQAGETTH